MKILHLISTLAPSSGGPTTVVTELARAQARFGHKITVCTTDRGNPVGEILDGQYFRTLFPENVTLLTFEVEFLPLLYSNKMAQWLSSTLSGFDIVHIHGLYRFPPTYAAWKARQLGVPYVICPHGALDPYLHGRSTTGNLLLKRLYERWFDLPNLNSATAVHYTAEEERGRASFLAINAPSFIVPNGVDWGRFQDLPSRGALRARLELGTLPVVLFLGRLHFKKGLDLLITAFDTLRRRIPDAQLVIAGPDNDGYESQVRSWVRQLNLDSAVHFVGPLMGNEVVQAYVDADVFALPSYTENFGMAVIEAMACALPVVISDQVNIHCDVSNAEAGLVTACSASEVAAALELLLRDAAYRRSIGKNGRQVVQERFTWPAIVEKLTLEYRKAIARHLIAVNGSAATTAARDTK